MNKISYLFIVISAVLWGLIGVFIKALGLYGLSSLQIVAVRAVTASIILLAYVIITDRSVLRIRLQDIKYFIGTGVLSIAFFNWCYFTAMQEVSLSVAVVLLYTAPAFVALMSRVIFKEMLTPKKIAALLIMLLGCSLVVGFLPKLDVVISSYGLLVGLGSGLGYALYSIFGKLATARYSSLTITTYTFLFASLSMVPVSGLWELGNLLLNGKVLALSFGLGLVPTSLAYILYTYGLSRVETSRAAIMANIEPVVAMMIGITFFGDKFTGWQLFGSVLILSAAVLVQKAEKPRNHSKVKLSSD